MMDFDTAFTRLLGHEGGYTPGHGDPGGETKWGISQRSYPDVYIRELTEDDAKIIYRRDFWNKIHGDELPDGIAFQLFGSAVHSGIAQTTRLYQRALGVADDGHWGPISAKAAREMSECDQILRFNAERLEFLTKLSTWPKFGKGWARRIAQNLRYGAEDVDDSASHAGVI
jgi:lysozyme family protein